MGTWSNSWAILGGAGLVLASLSATPLRAEDGPMVLAPATAWVVDYEDEACALRRSFGDPEQRVFLEMRQFSPGSMVQFTAYSDDLSVNRDEIGLALLPLEPLVPSSGGFFIDLGDHGDGFTFSRALVLHLPASTAAKTPVDGPANGPEFERLVTGLSLAGFRRVVELRTGSLGPPLAAMRGCLDELLSHWGVDVAAHRTLQRIAGVADMAHFNGYFTGFPGHMAWMRQSGIVHLRVMISAQGTATGCFLQGGMGNDDFGEHTCEQVMAYTGYRPALDAAGQPIDSFWTTTFNFRIEIMRL